MMMHSATIPRNSGSVLGNNIVHHAMLTAWSKG